MSLDIREESMAALDEYARIPVSFLVERIRRVATAAQQSERSPVHEEVVERPYIKDYDSIPGNHPTDWMRRFNTTEWRLLTAHENGRRIGGAIVAPATPELASHTPTSEIAILWDLRVRPESRRTGVATALFAAAERWAESKGCRELRVETQNVNVSACRLYERQGCRIESIDLNAYPDLPDEVRLIWSKPVGLGARAT